MKNQRAWSIFQIKSADDDQRILTGIATTPTADRMSDIVEPRGAQFTLPIPFLWQHDSGQPIGHVIKAAITDAGIEVVVQLAKISEPGVLRDRLDEAWQSIKAGLVRGLSIGFMPLESADIEGTWGRRFTSWDWMELSAVTIPANADASIATIKSLDGPVLRAATGEHAREPVRLGQPAGATASITLSTKESNVKTYAEQIAELTATRASKATRMTEIMNKAAAESRSSSADEAAEFDRLSTEVKTLEADISRVKQLEILNAETATPVQATIDPTQARAAAEAARTPGNGGHQIILQRELSQEPGMGFARFAMCLMAAKGDPSLARRIAEREIKQDKKLHAILRAAEEFGFGGIAEQIHKAAVAGGTATDPTWAGPLVYYQNYAGDFINFLRPKTVIGQFGQGGIPSLRHLPFNVRINGQTSGGSASWVGEGKAKPVTKFDFNAVTLAWTKIAAIAVLTEELIRFSDPSAEALVRDSLADAVIARMDTDFLDPSKGASAGVSPASITNGANNFVSTGTNIPSIRLELNRLWNYFDFTNYDTSSAVFIMNAWTLRRLVSLQNALGQAEFPGLTMRGGNLMGVPVLVSNYTPGDSNGSTLILAMASEIYLADDGQVTLDLSREASVQMDSAPSGDATSGTGSTLVSMFQTNSVALRAERYINWAKRRSGAVAYMTDVDWGTLTA